MNTVTWDNACAKAEEFIATIPPYPGQFAGRGIVICAGGPKYFTNAWICINMLRRWGCKLPIQIWHLGPGEMNSKMRSLVAPLGVECVDALALSEKHPARILNGYEVKPYSLIHCPFKEILLLDADNVPLVNPEFLFETPQYRKTGAIFWPDFNRLGSDRAIWKLCGVKFRDEPEFESGQIVINKETCWRALKLTMWYNEYSDFFYQHVHGDKETFHLAFHKVNKPYSMVDIPLKALECTMCQHDFEGNRIFQHRNLHKWDYNGENRHINGFQYEEICLGYLSELKTVWDGSSECRRIDLPNVSDDFRKVAERIVGREFDYHRVGYNRRTMVFLENGMIGQGAAHCEWYWDLKRERGGVVLEISSVNELTCRLSEGPDQIWRGRWVSHEKMPIELSPNGKVVNKATSLFIVSLPRSLSTVVYQAARRATGLRESLWSRDGEILNVDRLAFSTASDNAGEKFIRRAEQPDLFHKTTAFLNDVTKPTGYIYKDVVQPFILSEWQGSKTFNMIRIRRDVAEVAYSMLAQRWSYPRKIAENTSDLEFSVVQGLVHADVALDAVGGKHIDFDDLIVNENPLNKALATFYRDGDIRRIKYIDDNFKRMRQQITERRKSERYRKLAEYVEEARRLISEREQSAILT